MTQVDLDKIYPSVSSASSKREQQPSPNVNGNTKRNDAAKTVDKCGTISIIIGVISFLTISVPLLFAGGISRSGGTGQNYGAFALILFIPFIELLAPIFMMIALGGPIACGILLLISIVNTAQYKIRPLSCLVKPIIGVVLSNFYWLLFLL